MAQGFVLWFTGLSGSGKSTLTAMVSAELRRRGVHVETLDGDEIRKHLSKGLGFSREDRDANIRRIGFVAKLVARSGGCAIAAAISPYREIRNEIRRSIDRFCEVYTECPIDVLAERDPKGLYKKALAGEIKHFTGVDDPYQAPEDPEVHLYTDRETPDESLTKIVSRLEELGFIPTLTDGSSSPVASTVDGGLVSPHGRDLVDRVLRGDLAADTRERAAALPAVRLGRMAAAHFGFVACGAYSPLKGFLNSKDTMRVAAEARLESGAPWALPVLLPVTEADAKRVGDAAEVALANDAGELVGVLALSDVFRPSQAGLEAPAGAPLCLGGEIRAFRLLAWDGAAIPTPREARVAMTRRGWHRVTGLDVGASVPTLLTEYAARTALELSDGLLLRATAGENDALGLGVRLDCIRLLLENYFGPDCALFTWYPEARLEGARATLHAAILAQNYGASHLIVARDAGAPSREPLALHSGEMAIELVPMAAAGRSRKTGWLGTARTVPSDDLDPAPADLRGDWLRPEIAARLDSETEKGA